VDETTNTLDGKTAVVTGASSGIGETTARLLASKGCNIVLAARREERLESLTSELGEERALAVPTDVTDPEDCVTLIDQAVESFGSLDFLINNAGLGLYASLAEADPEDWRTMFDVNVLGVLYTTQAAVRRMLRQGSGHIVFLSSLAARRVPTSEASVYAATKHAIIAVVEGLRMDLSEKGIRVTSVEPALVRTEFPESSYPSAEEFYAGKGYAPLEAEDVASAVLYAVEQPPWVSVDEILLRSTEQPK
jgi:NADP-dependent 3-hydroxy acid dehydrogenase YdfG